jgi:hypothetical protein
MPFPNDDFGLVGELRYKISTEIFTGLRDVFKVVEEKQKQKLVI